VFEKEQHKRGSVKNIYTTKELKKRVKGLYKRLV
jgi:hypothetical protein